MKGQVLYSDVDVNQHMNHSGYIEWGLDAIGIEEFDNKYFSEVSVFFKKEMAPGVIAKIYRYIDDEYVKIVFKSKDEEIDYFEFGGYLVAV